jgi:hypothetical protein
LDQQRHAKKGAEKPDQQQLGDAELYGEFLDEKADDRKTNGVDHINQNPPQGQVTELRRHLLKTNLKNSREANPMAKSVPVSGPL